MTSINGTTRAGPTNRAVIYVIGISCRDGVIETARRKRSEYMIIANQHRCSGKEFPSTSIEGIESATWWGRLWTWVGVANRAIALIRIWRPITRALRCI